MSNNATKEIVSLNEGLLSILWVFAGCRRTSKARLCPPRANSFEERVKSVYAIIQGWAAYEWGGGLLVTGTKKSEKSGPKPSN